MYKLHKLNILLFVFITFSTNVSGDSIPEKKSFLKNVKDQAYEFVKGFSRVDTNYVEPQQYNFTVMLQNTNTYERYRMNNREGQSIVLSPEPSIKIGPYVGWRWIFLGYTLDIKHLNTSNHKKEFDVSLYSSQIGIDLFYRKTGNDYKIKRLYIGNDINTDKMINADFGGLNSSIKGFNIYYIFNHKKFSYPAAFSQSTVQRRSCGSPLVGFGYTKHSLDIDLVELNKMITDRLEPQLSASNHNQLTFGNYQYKDFSFSGGYGYNWVFSTNWLFASSLSVGVGYKESTGDLQKKHSSVRDFNIKNFNLDGIGRFGLVWNNSKWYAGASAIFHAYNYNKDQFSTNNVFGNLNIYVGFNFDRR